MSKFDGYLSFLPALFFFVVFVSVCMCVCVCVGGVFVGNVENVTRAHICSQYSRARAHAPTPTLKFLQITNTRTNTHTDKLIENTHETN